VFQNVKTNEYLSDKLTVRVDSSSILPYGQVS